MTATSDGFTGQSILVVFAHPDDESLASGGLLSACARRGAHVSLLCLSRGEHGPGGDDASTVDLGTVRARELEAAARVLGVTDVSLATFQDGMLPWVGEGVLQAHIARAMARVQPHVVITFDEDGLYWHPDHIAVHEAVTAAVRALGPTGPALYYVTMPPGQMRALANIIALRAPSRAGTPLFGIENPDAFGSCAPEPTLTVSVVEWAPLKLAALRCHRTQMAGEGLDALTDDDARSIFATECYRRSDVGSPAATLIDALATTRAHLS